MDFKLIDRRHVCICLAGRSMRLDAEGVPELMCKQMEIGFRGINVYEFREPMQAGWS